MQSPVILERSGIGQKEILDKAGIITKIELPGVGENLQEHYAGGAGFGEYLNLFYWLVLTDQSMTIQQN